MANAMNEYLFVSWNVRGLNNAVKRNKVLTMLNTMHAKIVYLQETHLTDETAETFAKMWGEHRYFACHRSDSRGVAVLIHPSVPFKVHATYADDEGRYLRIRGLLGDKLLTLVNVYGPNVDTPLFYEKILGELEGEGIGEWIVGGDFNLTLTTDMDRSSTTLGRLARAAKYVNEWMDECDMMDVWRRRHPIARQYSFYSPPHGIFSRIDFYLMSNSLNENVIDCGIDPRILSDHGPVWVKIRIGVDEKKIKWWRFKNRALRDEVFRNQLSEIVTEFFEANDPADTSEATTWQALKVYLRGRCMTLEGGVLRSIRHDLNKARLQLEQEDSKCQTKMPDADMLLVTKLQGEVDECLNRELLYLVWPAKVLQYVEGERPSRTLARIIHREDSKGRTIVQIRDAQGVLKHHTKEIAEVFHTHFSALYGQGEVQDGTSVTQYLEGLELPVLSRESVELLEAPLSLEEVEQAIKDLAPGKAPGMDGIDLSFYKCYSGRIAPRLLALYNELLDGGEMPRYMAETLIILLPKPGKDLTLCTSYRPLSLINSDLKILAKLLANRLVPLLSEVITDDQSGFMLGCSTTDNLRRLQTVAAVVDKDSYSSVVSLDAARAFDTILWPYLFTTLRKLGMGPFFLKLIQLLYSNARAQLLINGTLTDFFMVQRGTRQGCPLSPALFNLAYEPLLVALRRALTGKGVRINQVETVVSAYADDVLIYLHDPRDSLQIVTEVLQKYGEH